MNEDPQREKVRGLGRHDLHGKGRRGKKKGRTEESERNERGKGKKDWMAGKENLLQKKVGRLSGRTNQGKKGVVAPKRLVDLRPGRGAPFSPCDVTGPAYERCPYRNLLTFLYLSGFN